MQLEIFWFDFKSRKVNIGLNIGFLDIERHKHIHIHTHIERERGNNQMDSDYLTMSLTCRHYC